MPLIAGATGKIYRKLAAVPTSGCGSMIPGPYEKPEAYRLPASHTAGLAVQVCDSHFRTFPMYSLNLKINTKMKKYGT